MKAAILNIATAVPDVCLAQDQYLDFVTHLLTLDQRYASIVRRFTQRAEINTRHSVIQDFKKSPSEWTFFNANAPDIFPTTQQRNDIYKIHAPALSYTVAKKVLDEWGQPRSHISHIIYVSCTGLQAPGIEFLLMTQLGLAPTTQRLAITFMGCFGAFRALAVANAIAQQDPKHRILIICTELCSLHIQPHLLMDTIIGNALFADGSTAMIVGSGQQSGEKPLWEIERCATAMIENSPHAMTWDVSDSGFVMRLSHEVPAYLRTKIGSFAHSLLDGIQVSHADWPVHPGGKAILIAIEEVCKLDRRQTQSSWDTLGKYGNMSSATFPFVLLDLSKKSRLPWAIGLGFGPGLSIEGILLKTVGS